MLRAGFFRLKNAMHRLSETDMSRVFWIVPIVFGTAELGSKFPAGYTIQCVQLRPGPRISIRSRVPGISLPIPVSSPGLKSAAGTSLVAAPAPVRSSISRCPRLWFPASKRHMPPVFVLS